MALFPSLGAPDPKAPEAEAAAPTMDTTTAPSEPAKSEENKSAGLSAPAPKPVEVMSVPETPINNRTPAGGTPRPELNIEEEPKEPPKNEDEAAFVTTGVETGSAPAVSAPKDTSMTDKPADDKPTEAATNGASKPSVDDVTEAAAGEKRKLGEAAPATNGAAPVEAEKPEPEERAKKARVEDVSDEPTATETAMNGKGTKAKKEKKAPPTVGRTARKTRSQGPAEAD
ncbi:hypothetical protein ACHAPT_004240 [Fusarium lateritium]